VYEDRAVRDAVNSQEPFVLRQPNSPASLCIKELAKSLITGEKMGEVGKGWRNILDKIFS
ncbi:MAG: MinD/ParA family protein, partial [Selenomonadaceae bacterium]|nr:MinD/ParA family protein [Selenomonadaceae bacterium]